MTSQAAKILEQTLKLPQEARAALAGKLILSLDERVDRDAEAAWVAEVDRRLALVDSGKTESLSWDQVEDHILKSRRADRVVRIIAGAAAEIWARKPITGSGVSTLRMLSLLSSGVVLLLSSRLPRGGR